MGSSRGDYVSLGSVVENVRGSVKPDEMEPEADYILLEHMVSGTGLVRPVKIAGQKIGSNKSQFDAGDILYGKLRPNLRKVCVAGAPGYCSMDIIPLRPLQDGTSHYLAAVLRSEKFTSEVMRMVSGANLPRIGVKDLMKFEIPWPDQQRLAVLNAVCLEGVELRQNIDELAQQIEMFESSLWVH